MVNFYRSYNEGNNTCPLHNVTVKAIKLGELNENKALLLELDKV